jgi:hypothetical protein
MSLSDLKHSWLNIARRLQDSGNNVKSGYSIFTIRVLVNGVGEAVAWSAPVETRIEPGKSNFEDILGLILGEMSSDKARTHSKG